MKSMYVRFGLVMLASLFTMWVLTMSMIRTWDHFYFNLSNLYMALIMVAAMGPLMLLGMWGMLPNRRVNLAVLAGFLVLLIAGFALGRSEAFVGNEAFLKSMIPHHSRAILVCEESSITDAEIATLCDQIIQTQRDEIRQMEDILRRY